MQAFARASAATEYPNSPPNARVPLPMWRMGARMAGRCSAGHAMEHWSAAKEGGTSPGQAGVTGGSRPGTARSGGAAGRARQGGAAGCCPAGPAAAEQEEAGDTQGLLLRANCQLRIQVAQSAQQQRGAGPQLRAHETYAPTSSVVRPPINCSGCLSPASKQSKRRCRRAVRRLSPAGNARATWQ